MYIDADGNKYESYKDYVDSPDLDPETVYIKLLSGARTPQNEEERKIKAEMDEIIANGGIVETNINI